jgi:hypothetical protein
MRARTLRFEHNEGVVAIRHDGDRYDKSFRSRDHLVALIFAPFSAAKRLQGVTMSWYAQSQNLATMLHSRLVISQRTAKSKRVADELGQPCCR